MPVTFKCHRRNFERAYQFLHWSTKHLCRPANFCNGTNAHSHEYLPLQFLCFLHHTKNSNLNPVSSPAAFKKNGKMVVFRDPHEASYFGLAYQGWQRHGHNAKIIYFCINKCSCGREPVIGQVWLGCVLLFGKYALAMHTSGFWAERPHWIDLLLS